MPRLPSRYVQAMERAFLRRYREGDTSVLVERQDLIDAAEDLGIQRAANVGDVPYAFRYRRALPHSIAEKAPAGTEWLILGAGTGRYRFEARPPVRIIPSTAIAETRIPDATPGVIARYALSDEQALLAKLRYNRLLDVFTGIACYSLQSHLRTQVRGLGQVETDEVYIGIDKRGAHYVLPVQAKGGRDRASAVQILQDIALCADKFPALIAKPIAAQFVGHDLIALFELEEVAGEVRIASERHYRLVAHNGVTDSDLAAYRARTL